jgi:tetratricopeptide (TPR) repeat protein
MQLPRFISRTFVLVIFSLCLSFAHASELLDKAALLINQQKSKEAYELLFAEYEQHAGSPEFDLLLGIAALNAGKPTQSVFALERVLAVEPENAMARAELARAYFEMGENEAAKEEFNEVKDKGLPDSIESTIEKYLSAIDGRIGAKKTRIDVYIDGTFGYDSNVNSATDTSIVAIPAFGNLQFTLDNTGRELDSGFFSLGAGTFFSTPFMDKESLRIYGGINLNERITFNESDFRTRTLNGQLGLRYTQGKNAFLGSLSGQKYYLDGDSNRDLGGVNLQWLHTANKRTQYSVFGSYAAQRFPEQKVRNVNQFSGGMGIVHALDREGAPIIYASLSAGTDEELRNSRPDIGRKFINLRIGGQYSLSEKMTLQGSVSYQYSNYGGDDPLFLTDRSDDFFLLRTGLVYTLVRGWSIRPEIQYSNNSSNIVINDFDSWQGFVTIRNQF